MIFGGALRRPIFSLRLTKPLLASLPCRSLALYSPAMSASTLHKGVSEIDHGDDAGHRPADAPFKNLGGAFAVKSDAAAAARDGGSRGTQREGRSFEDVLAILDDMTSGRPNRCPDNLAVTNRLLDRLGMRPIFEKMRFVHIAGTKGKGTTAAYTAALLQGYGFKVGLFTSPHLIDVRERMLVDNRFLTKDTFARYFFEFRDHYESLKHSESDMDREAASRANYFRFLFLLSLHIFAAENVDIAVMEVGLGGRIDATNTVPAEVSIITALGYDHMEIIGNTIAEIAGEKAGIMKANTMCLSSPQRDHPETRKVLEAAARDAQTPLILLDDEVLPIRSWPPLAIGGDHAVEDSKLALMAARHMAGIPPVLPLDERERAILRQMTFTGRSQIAPVDGGRDMTLYLDGAHTAESLAHATKWFVEASAAVTKDEKPRRVLLLYTSRDPHRIMKAFMPFISAFTKVVIAQVGNPKMSATSPPKDDAEACTAQMREELVRSTETWRDMYREVTCLPCGRPFSALEDMVDLIVPAAAEGEDASKPAQVFVTGSIYLVGEVLKMLHVYESGARRREE
uniref:tetrahydrofolate synthase n=1 Tax=Herpetomonas muscarum TaxID=5718 RepID=T1YTV6_HERMU|nr:tetrahydrofolate synthase [Herpetomonas muscarum]